MYFFTTHSRYDAQPCSFRGLAIARGALDPCARLLLHVRDELRVARLACVLEVPREEILHLLRREAKRGDTFEQAAGRLGLCLAQLHVDVDGPDVHALWIVRQNPVKDSAPALGQPVAELELRKLGDDLHVAGPRERVYGALQDGLGFRRRPARHQSGHPCDPNI